jgi:acetyl-CoA synthetase
MTSLARSIVAFCRERVAPYKRIRRVEFGDLPKTISGKIRRVELRGQENAPRASVRGVTEFWEEDFTWLPEGGGRDGQCAMGSTR